MIPPSIPEDESARLAELEALRILDTPPEERFDRITRLAASIFNVPIAFVAMVDSDRQWFKSRCGVTAESTTRAVSFCGHAILGEGPLIVPDALLDERFRDNPLVVDDPKIRFYAGYPLRGPGGHNVGTLCLADRKPRTEHGLPNESFVELAGLAEHELGLVDVIAAQKEVLETKDALLATREALARELRDAAVYVASLLPEPFDDGRATFDARFHPSSALGGDFVGCIPIDGRLAFYLLDVTGHGVASSLMAVSIHHFMRQRILGGESESPASMLEAVNRAFPMEDHDGRFATLWFGLLDPATRRLEYASAGHHPAIMITPSATERLEGAGLPIGVQRDSAYTVREVELAPDSRLYLFSDGLFEETIEDGTRLGIERLVRIIEREARTSGSAMRGILDHVSEACGGSFHDDVSLAEIGCS